MLHTLLTNFATAPPGCSKPFLGLLPWYHYLPSDRFEGCDIKSFKVLGANSDIPFVLLAIVDDLLRIAGIVAVAFIIVGATQLIISQGNSDDTAKARGTVINALIGLIIALVAIAFVNYLGDRLG